MNGLRPRTITGQAATEDPTGVYGWYKKVFKILFNDFFLKRFIL
jgi:hypothetical protein